MRIRHLALPLVVAASLAGHPMGNYSVSHYTRIEVGRSGASMLYVLDLAEIPTFELFRQWGLERASPGLEARAVEQAREWTRNLRVTSNGRAVTPRFLGADLTVADGAAGIPVARIAARLSLPVTAGKLEFEDPNYAERAGWKEIVVRAREGAMIATATQGDQDRSQALTAYPQDPTVAPPQDVRASIEWSTAAVAAPMLSKSPVPVVTPPPSVPIAP